MTEHGQELVLAPVGSLERLRSIGHPLFEVLIGEPKRFLHARALHGFALQRFVDACQLPRLSEQFHEHGDLRSQDFAVDGLDQVVNGACAVAAQDVLLVEHVRGEKEDRHMTRPRPRLDQVRQLDAAHARHSDVEHDGGEVLFKKREKCLVGGMRAHQPALERGEQGLHRIEVRHLIVDDEDWRAIAVIRLGRRRKPGGCTGD